MVWRDYQWLKSIANAGKCSASLGQNLIIIAFCVAKIWNFSDFVVFCYKNTKSSNRIGGMVSFDSDSAENVFVSLSLSSNWTPLFTNNWFYPETVKMQRIIKNWYISI